MLNKLLFIFTILLTFGVNASAQTTEPDTVTISRTAAIAADKAFDLNGALEAEVKTLRENIVALKLELERAFGNVRAESEGKIAAQAETQRIYARFDACLAAKKSKQIGLINFKLGGT